MNIYHIKWVTGGYHMNAVVIASSEKIALDTLGLPPGVEEVRVFLIGLCTSGALVTEVVCEESL